MKKNFDFSPFYLYNNGQYAQISPNFLQWFVGFFEGDGSLIINNRNEQNFVITQNTSDIQVLEYIVNTQGFGHVVKQSETTSRYTVQKLEDLYKLLQIQNGNICLPSRMKGLEKFQIFFNEKLVKNKRGKYKYLLNPISMCYIPCIPSLSDAWFSGFIDAEGCFSVLFLKRTSKYRIRMLVAQKGDENLPLFSYFIQMFKGGHIEKHSKPHVYSYVVSGKENCILVKPYFEKFFLHTKKAQSYVQWCEILDHIKKKNHFKPEMLSILIEKAKQINKNLKKFI